MYEWQRQAKEGRKEKWAHVRAFLLFTCIEPLLLCFCYCFGTVFCTFDLNIIVSLIPQAFWYGESGSESNKFI